VTEEVQDTIHKLMGQGVRAQVRFCSDNGSNGKPMPKLGVQAAEDHA
jgi:hypothetical protein